ncbi:MAG: c-type cytochrome [Chloroflexi bacterium]|nr:c-type cytochrome [Chloroflexota bacterium]
MYRKLVLSVILMLVLVVLTVAYVAFEPSRQAGAAKRQRDEAVAQGAKLYAASCMSCHGPRGGGAIGPPLDRAVFREGGPEELRAASEPLREAIRAGRPGTAIPSFLRAPDGSWISRTVMPPWTQEKGGPLTAQGVEDLVAFIQYGDWSKPVALAGAPKMEGQAPATRGLSPQEAEKGLALFRAKGCLGCHALGNMGGKQGPDLTNVGSWRDAQFLRDVIQDPNRVDRSNYIWITGQKIPMGKPLMPAIPMNADELKTLVDYLSALGPAPIAAQAPRPAAGLPTPAAVVPTAAPTAAPPAVTKPQATPTAAASAPTPTTAPAPAAPTRPEAVAGDPALGKTVFDASCNACHPSGRQGVGPSLVGLATRQGEGAISSSIRNGKGSMPPFAESTINAKQLADLLAFLGTLK